MNKRHTTKINKKTATRLKKVLDVDEFKEKLKDKNFARKIRIPTIWNIKPPTSKEPDKDNSMFNFTTEQAERNTGTLQVIDTKIQCPKCKNGLMHRAYKEVNLIFFSMKSYTGWLCQNKKCHHFIKRAEIYKDWGHEYKDRIDLEIE